MISSTRLSGVLICLTFLVSPDLLWAQDVIVTPDHEELKVHLREIGVKFIRYTRADYADGPEFVISKKDVYYIRYANGTCDTFNKQPAVTSRLIEQRGKWYYQNGRQLTQTELVKLLSAEGHPRSSKAIQDAEKLLSSTGQKMGAGIILVSAGIIFLPVMAFNSELIQPPYFRTVFFVADLAMIGLGIVVVVRSALQPFRKQKAVHDAVSIYNEEALNVK